MALRDLSAIPYLPLVDVRPAELMALAELPEKDKDLLLPVFKLRPWVSAERIDSALHRLAQVYGNRASFLELGPHEAFDPLKARVVHSELADLRLPGGGYQNWVDFFSREECKRFIPILQLTDQFQFSAQVDALYGLGRGLGIRVDASEIGVEPEQFAKLISEQTDSGRDVLFILDYGKQTGRFAQLKDTVKRQAVAILEACTNVPTVALSASSFPDGFTSIDSQDIFERDVFNRLHNELGARITYSDRGSARAEAISGGGGSPTPRVDYALADKWVFFREDSAIAKTQASLISFQHQAKLLMESDFWDSKLKLWGCQMIEKTAIGDVAGIFSANRCTAARINIHLHQQLHYGDKSGLYDTDEDWTEF